MKQLLLTAITFVSIFLNGCSKDGEGFNLFTIDDDKELGLQVKQEIESQPGQYPILSKTTYSAAYSYLNGIRNDILAAGKVTHRDDFVWEMNIIKDDSVLNAFCTPGGYIYVYTGLIKYLDNKSSLAGVLGHEMAHADKRHSTEMLTKQYGIQLLLDIVVGKNQNAITQVLGGITSLSFSRTNETEADKYSVVYLCPSPYHADGAANFFQKIINQGTSNPPEFLSTHPNPDNRVQNIHNEASTLGCTATIDQTKDVAEYSQFKNSL